MDILGVGIPELFIVILLLLVVAGPRRMVRWGYIMGREMGKLRRMWEETRKIIQEEIEVAGLDEEVRELKKTGQDLQNTLRNARQPLSSANRMKSYEDMANALIAPQDNGARSDQEQPQPYKSETPEEPQPAEPDDENEAPEDKTP